MAKKTSQVYLGYEEEEVTSKNQTQTSYTTNKIGGFPDWPPKEKIQFTEKCSLCGLHKFLIVQCYAPLENSVYHRTLYIFACINPNCWIQSESWTCLRVQIADDSSHQSNSVVALPTVDSSLNWCSGADDWDENDNGDTENGNIINIDNAFNEIQRNSDEDEESNSFEMESVESALGNLQVYDAHNANMSPIQGAVGGLSGPPEAAAELEGGDEPGLVTVETPTVANNDAQLLRLLNQTATLPPDILRRLTVTQMQFAPKFIYVEEEFKKRTVNDDRVLELLNKYKQENELASPTVEAAGAGGLPGDEEQYEDAAPLHGDRLFHNFITKLRDSPGQILRYSRDEPPLLGAPLPSSPNSPDAPYMPTKCLRCGSRLICELQLLPEFGSTLALLPNHVKLSHLQFLSVLIFTCSDSCWQKDDTFAQETVVFQPEIV